MSLTKSAEAYQTENNSNDTLKKQNKIVRDLDDLIYALEPFYRIDFQKLQEAQKTIKQLRNEIVHYIPSIGLERFDNIASSSIKSNVIGLLPMMLLSEDLFPTHRDLLDFAKYTLNIELRRLNRPSRTRIIGEIIAQVAKVQTSEMELVYKKLQDFIRKKSFKNKNFFSDWDSAIRSMRSGNDDGRT
jgi:hypothetical protein